VAGCASEPEQAEGITAAVFEDSNGNGLRDDGEPGIPNVMVSNGAQVRLTGKDGQCKLPLGGDLVFITTPRGFTPTESWYRPIVPMFLTNAPYDFPLQPAPEKDSSEFTFAQITDIHLDADHLADFADLVAELNLLTPDFVVATGDLIAEGNKATVAQAEEWFNMYRDATAGLDMPLFNAVGNHDVVGIKRQDIAETDPGYGKGLFTGLFGPTYYSFDWGEFHCVVIDPNDMADGEQVYQMSPAQLEWLEADLKLREDSPLLLFYHEPTASWRNRQALVDLLKRREVSMFCGHLHQDTTVAAIPGESSLSLREQITGAVAGEWWHGGNPCGRPAGYRLISASGDAIDSLYKGTEEERVIDLDLRQAAYERWPVVNGHLELIARVFSEHGSISAASYHVDGGDPVAMAVESGEPWSLATAGWDTASVTQDSYHTITIAATDAAGPFSRDIEVRVSADARVAIADLYAHFDAHQGYYVTLEGTVPYALVEDSIIPQLSLPLGMGVFKVSDGEGDANAVLIIAGECFSPALGQHEHVQGNSVRVVAVPLRLSWDFITSSTEYSMMQQMIGMLPAGMLEKDGSGNIVAVRGLRLLSAGDITEL
jgi:predicted MPP superfamily phosphohydrolase